MFLSFPPDYIIFLNLFYSNKLIKAHFYVGSNEIIFLDSFESIVFGRVQKTWIFFVVPLQALDL